MDIISFLFLFFTDMSKLMFHKNCKRQDLNLGLLVLEAIVLRTVPQPLPQNIFLLTLRLEVKIQ